MIIATAGHIDHGKTTLVQALTGIDTDRLAEEKRRGMTIDLGFAYARTAGGASFGIVDVPGHERFVRTMIAGVAAIDFALLVIAADDGPMPQTREHIAILDLLGIERGAVALTKADRVNTARVEEAGREIADLLSGTGLDGAPVFPVVGPTGQGVEALRHHLEREAEALPGRSGRGRFRLVIDRSFVLAGAGRVVTGAAVAGRVRIGDHLTLSPQGVPVRVRGIHVQNEPADTAVAGQRCAINVAALDARQVEAGRGDWLVAAEAHAPASRIDLDLRVAAGEARALATGTPVHFHLGAADIGGRLSILEGRSIAPGGRGLAQVLLDRPIGALRGDRFIIRDQSAQRTLGGGMVLDPAPPARGRARPARLAYLAAMRSATPEAALLGAISCQPDGVDLAAFERNWNLDDAGIAALRALAGVKVVDRPGGTRALSEDAWTGLLAAIEATVGRLHAEAPEVAGFSEATIRAALPQPCTPLVAAEAIGALLVEGRLARAGIGLRLPGHTVRLTPEDAGLWQVLEPLFAESGQRAPALGALATAAATDLRDLQSALARFAHFGLLVQVAPGRFLTPAAVTELAAMVEAVASSTDGAFDAAAYRDRSGIGRNLTIQVLEYFDRVRLTARLDKNTRRLLRPAAEVFGNPP